MKLNLGSGEFPIENYVNVDFNPDVKPDVVLDLNNPKSLDMFSPTYDHIVMNHCLEHLSDTFGIIRQCHRILLPKGMLEIRVPHFSRGFTHPEHQRGFDVTFPEYMNSSFKGGYIGVQFKLVSIKMEWMIRFDLKEPYLTKWQIIILKFLNKIISYIANLNPHFCSRFWCYFVGGFEQIEFILCKTL